MDERLIEVTLKIYNPVCILSRELGSLVKIEDVRSYGDRVAHLIELSQEKFEEAKRLASETEGVLQGVKSRKGVTTCWFLSKGCDACRPIALGEAFLVRGKLLDDGSMEFSFIVPGEDSYIKILSELRNAGIVFDIVRVSGFKSSRLLTPNQEKTLYIAMRMGLFDHPRRITVQELANVLGIKPSTLTETLRRGLKRILKHYFG